MAQAQPGSSSGSSNAVLGACAGGGAEPASTSSDYECLAKRLIKFFFLFGVPGPAAEVLQADTRSSIARVKQNSKSWGGSRFRVPISNENRRRQKSNLFLQEVPIDLG